MASKHWGANLRFFDFLACSICSWMQCARERNSFVKIFSSVHSPMSHNSWSESVDRNAVKRHLGATVPMWDVYYQPVNISTDYAPIPFHCYYCTFSCLTITCESQNATNYSDHASLLDVLLGRVRFGQGFLRVKTDPTSEPEYSGNVPPTSHLNDFKEDSHIDISPPQCEAIAIPLNPLINVCSAVETRSVGNNFREAQLVWDKCWPELLFLKWKSFYLASLLMFRCPFAQCLQPRLFT